MYHLLGFLKWLISEGSVGAATWGLVLVTVGLVIDGFRKSREQRDRWDRENKVRADAAQPKAVVEPAKRENYPHVIALCYNLGERPFVIDKTDYLCPKRSENAIDPNKRPPRAARCPGWRLRASFGRLHRAAEG